MARHAGRRVAPTAAAVSDAAAAAAAAAADAADAAASAAAADAASLAADFALAAHQRASALQLSPHGRGEPDGPSRSAAIAALDADAAAAAA